MTRTQLPGTVDYHVPAEWYGDFISDYDTAAIDARVLLELNRLAEERAPTTTVHTNGQVTVDADLACYAQRLDWRALLDMIDVNVIASLHDRTMTNLRAAR